MADSDFTRAKDRALMQCVDAMRDYIVPNGITAGQFADRIIAALDNGEINPAIADLDRAEAAREHYLTLAIEAVNRNLVREAPLSREIIADLRRTFA